jgi:hypothetical protein
LCGAAGHAGLNNSARQAGNAQRRLSNFGKEKAMDFAIQGIIWLGAGVTLVMLLSRRRKHRTLR